MLQHVSCQNCDRKTSGIAQLNFFYFARTILKKHFRVNFPKLLSTGRAWRMDLKHFSEYIFLAFQNIIQMHISCF